MLQAARDSITKFVFQFPVTRSTTLTSVPHPVFRSVPVVNLFPHESQPRAVHSPLPPPEPYPLPPQVRRSPSPPLPHLRLVTRRGCSGGGPIDYTKEVDEINLKFAEAREDIEAALESKETVYFDEEAECARDSVKAALGMFRDLLARLPEKERAALQRSMGLKMEQLKAELQQLDD